PALLHSLHENTSCGDQGLFISQQYPLTGTRGGQGRRQTSRANNGRHDGSYLGVGSRVGQRLCAYPDFRQSTTLPCIQKTAASRLVRHQNNASRTVLSLL